MSRATPTHRGPLADALAQVGALLDFAVRTALAVPRALRTARGPWWREFLGQAWFLVAVTTGPALLVTVPLGVLVALNVGSLAGQLGAEGYTGAVVAFIVVGQAAPLVCALMISGVGGSAMCADLGARTLREEVAALEVMGVPVVERLVVPRVLAAVLTTVLLACLVMLVGIGTTFLFQTGLLGASPGTFLATFVQYSRAPDFAVALVKAAAFAALAALACCFKGLRVGGGPGGVATAVNEAVVLAFILVFVANTAISELYAVLVPAKGEF
ncbi:ABC transporter permease [Saccharopolyspora cebuensis]|uniref:MlaE family ABC transporter permease n=1 Tax=Saccharopolyspora cebuensis TaxID=418759 RepID=A0ABV4CJY2_9PSEU